MESKFNNEKFKIFPKFNQRRTANGNLSNYDTFAFQAMFDGREYWDPDIGEWKIDHNSDNQYYHSNNNTDNPPSYNR